MPDTTKWDLAPHTGAKHVIVREYLVRWFPIMSTVERKLIYFDGFAGPGRYASGEDGSPIVALKALLEHARRDHILATTEVVFVFVEADAERHQSLTDELDTLKASVGGAWPANMQILPPIHASFPGSSRTQREIALDPKPLAGEQTPCRRKTATDSAISRQRTSSLNEPRDARATRRSPECGGQPIW